MTSFVVLANLPDAPLPGWGHDRYLVSHSLFVNGAIIAVLMLGLSVWHVARDRIGGLQVMVGSAMAWLSHMLLDSFYNHGRGIAIFWPFGLGRLALPIPWFSTLGGFPPSLDAHTVYVCVVELLCYGPLLVLAMYWRHRVVQQSPS